MKEGDVVLTPLPQADGKLKNRPAVVLRVMPQYGDLLVCGVSTQVHQEVAGFDETIRVGRKYSVRELDLIGFLRR
jgi:mRNA interferase MazF